MTTIHLTDAQRETLIRTLRFSASRLSRIAGAAKHSQAKREWAAEQVTIFTDILDQLDG